jgi:hypothetical protein
VKDEDASARAAIELARAVRECLRTWSATFRLCLVLIVAAIAFAALALAYHFR